MKFDPRNFAEDIGLLVKEFAAAEVERMLDKICPLDVADAGFFLEDCGKLKNADDVFDVTVEKLSIMMQETA